MAERQANAASGGRVQELEARVKELEEGHAALIDRMATVVSHEIRNPLAVIKNSLYFVKTKLQAAGPPDAKVSKHMGFMEAEVDRADGILGEILAYARLPAPALQPGRVDSMVSDLVDRRTIPGGIKVDLRLSASEARSPMEASQLQKAIDELLDNAVEAMGTAGTLTISTACVKGGKVRIEVADTGPGIPAGDADQIFLPFFTTKPRGVGVGLAMARKIVERHAGTLDLAAGRGKGAAFVLLLPLAS